MVKSFSGLKLLLAIGAASAALSSAAVAADAPYRYGAPAQPVQEFFSNWYLRLDAGYRFNDLSTGDALGYRFNITDFKNSGTVGGGVGYKWGWFRGDITFDYGNAPQFAAITGAAPALNVPFAALSSYSVTSKLATYTTLANAYIDLGTWWGFTPYIGAGIGATYLKPTSFDLYDTATGTSYGSLGTDAKWQFSWAASGGLSYQISPIFIIDASYRYLDLGKAHKVVNATGTGNTEVNFGSLTAQEVRLGLRYLIP